MCAVATLTNVTGGTITSPLGSVDVLNDCARVLSRSFPAYPKDYTPTCHG